MNAYDGSLIPFFEVVDEKLKGLFRSFEKDFFGEFTKQSPKFIFLDVLFSLQMLAECLLFVHCSYIIMTNIKHHLGIKLSLWDDKGPYFLSISLRWFRSYCPSFIRSS